MEGKTLFFRECFNKGILSIQDLLDDTGRIMSYAEFKSRYACKVNFLQYYQVISAFPKNLLNKAEPAIELGKSYIPLRMVSFN